MTGYLPDTHTFFWFITDHPSLSRLVRDLIIEPKNAICISIATPWEIAIKSGLGKLVLNEPFDPYIAREIAQNKFRLLPIRLSHLTNSRLFPTTTATPSTAS